MKRRYLLVISIIVLLAILVIFYGFVKREDFKTFIKMKKVGELYFIDLEIGNTYYKNILIDTGSSYLLLKDYKPGKNAVSMSNKSYDIYTVYGGTSLTMDQCLAKNDKPDNKSVESCGVNKLYTDNVYGNSVTICDVLHGNAYNILGLTCYGF